MTLSPQAVCLNGRTKRRSTSEPGASKSAAIAAGRDDGELLGLCRVLRVVEMLGGEVVDHLDRQVLQVGERARRDQSADRSAFGAFAHALARAVELALDQRQRGFAQAALIAFGTGQRGEVAPQRVAVEQFDAVQPFVAQIDPFCVGPVIQ